MIIIKDANDIKFIASSSFIILFINKFFDVIINILNELKRMIFVLNKVVLNYCCKI